MQSEALKWGYIWAKVSSSQVRGVSLDRSLNDILGITENEDQPSSHHVEFETGASKFNHELDQVLGLIKEEISWILSDDGLHTRLEQLSADILVTFDDVLEEVALWEFSFKHPERLSESAYSNQASILLKVLSELRNKVTFLL